MLATNLILNADSYKASHYLQYPAKTTHVSSYIEARSGEVDQSLFFGLQMFIKQYLLTPISQQDIDDAEQVITAHGLPFNRQGWQHILEQHQGYLPIEIQALPEGSITPLRNCLLQVVNTDPEVPWLTSYVETMLLRAIWYPTTVATESWHCRQVISEYLTKTADNLDGLAFKLHDFGARGVSSEQSAGIGGLAHLINFMGTDTMTALIYAKTFYHEPMAGFSIPAAEHSTITSWGKDQETQAYDNMLTQFAGKDKLVAVVSDSYDLFNAIDNIWGETLAQKVKTQGGTIVIRPDSGDPVTIVAATLEKLIAKFGATTNSKGYQLLPSYLRVIQGDGVNRDSIRAILAELKSRKISADNIAFGMGGQLLQKLDRDTLNFAMKASAAKVDGKWRDVFKAPATDNQKRSKKGRLAVIKNKQDQFETIGENELDDQQNQLRTVFKDGKLLIDEDLATIRGRLG